MGYALPSNTSNVSDSWQEHKNRNPPSPEPGTDYTSSYGAPLYAVEAGKVEIVQTGNHNGTGRFIQYRLNDGRTTRSLHLSEVWVKAGQTVTRGQQIGKTGASGYGNDWYYGPHVHQTLFPGAAFAAPSIDFEKYVGSGGSVGKTQRVAGPDGVNGRNDPSTKNPATQFLAPGVVGNFDGWINGESVSGNKVWFRGISGDFFWSGGFTDKGTHDLTNLNPSTLLPYQRQVLSTASVNGRNDPSTNGPVTQSLAAGAVGDFDGWINGQTVEGNKVWFRGLHSGDFFWSGGFTDKGTHDLKDLNPITPPPANTNRTAGAEPVNVRALPYTTSPAVDVLSAGTVVQMSNWTNAEKVENNDVWFQTPDSKWMWSGGFTSQSTDGLTKVVTPTPPTPVSPDNPRGLPEYPPVYERAHIGLKAPLGYNADGTPVSRLTKGDPPVPVSGIIDRFIIHHTATTSDQLDYFSYVNSRKVCPSFYLRTDGNVFELIRAGGKPAATGAEWNWRSIAVETQNSTSGPTWQVTDAQLEELAQIAAWLAEYDGKILDGSPVTFRIDRTHIISHQEALPGTECPGPYIQGRMDAIVARAQEIYDENHPPVPPDPNTITITKAQADAILTASASLTKLIEDTFGE